MTGINVIRLSENALCGLLMSAIESYTEKNLNMEKPRNLLETYGSLYGHETMVNDGHRIFQVELASVSSTCQQANDRVLFNVNHIHLKNELSQAFFPHLSFLGDFHTHPYTHFQVVENNQGYYFSDTDRKELTRSSEEMKALKYRIGMVLAISYSRRALQTKAEFADRENNSIRMDFDHFRIWITGYVIEEAENGLLYYNEDNSEKVLLHIPCLMGICQMSSFGRLTGKGRHVSWRPALCP